MTGTAVPAQRDEIYKKLFSEMVDGFVLHEAVYDSNGAVYDYRFIEVNPAYERIAGLISSSIIGRTVREVFPGTGSFLMEIFKRVVSTGTPQIF